MDTFLLNWSLKQIWMDKLEAAVFLEKEIFYSETKII